MNEDDAFDNQKEETSVYSSFYYRARRQKQFASIFELVVIVLSFIIVFLSRANDSSFQSDRDIQTVLNVLTSPVMIGFSVLIFLEVFNLILTGGSLLVDAIDTARRANKSTLKFASPMSAASSKAPPEQRTEPAPDAASIDRLFRSYIARSQAATAVSQRRPNVLLFVGTTIAVLGLIFFVATLPQSGPDFVVSGASNDHNVALNTYEKLINVVPRVLMLLFIQLLAGFFLRQYRSSMEEFRYYEALLRRREAQYMSFNLRRDIDDKKSLAKFAEHLLEEREYGILNSKQTTAIMQAHREEQNEFHPAVDRLLALRDIAFGARRKTPLRRAKRHKEDGS